jgi:hypothetical protein
LNPDGPSSISTRVNKPDNDDAAILDPLEPVEGETPTLP